MQWPKIKVGGLSIEGQNGPGYMCLHLGVLHVCVQLQLRNALSCQHMYAWIGVLNPGTCSSKPPLLIPSKRGLDEWMCSSVAGGFEQARPVKQQKMGPDDSRCFPVVNSAYRWCHVSVAVII